MARHRTREEKLELAERARRLREEGLSRREIQDELGIGEDLAKAFLRGVPVPDHRRPHAKQAERQAAIAMRARGRTYNEIAAELGVSKGSLSLWLRTADAADEPSPPAPPAGDDVNLREKARELRLDGRVLFEIAESLGVSTKTVYYWTWDLPVPRSAGGSGGSAEHMEMMRRRYWDRVLAEREEERLRIRAEHEARVERLSSRELELLAVTAYWCEGTKSKPYARREQVVFINSDPGLILLFLTWLDQIDFPREHRHFSLSIHESADVPGATAWWSAVTGVPSDDFGRPVLKRHNPKTVRKNTSDAYVGCLVIRLRQCRSLYQQIEGVWQGIMGGLPGGTTSDLSRVV